MKLIPPKTKGFVKKIFNKLTWDIDTKEKSIYLTFDDGPTPEITTWVLQTLNDFEAKATFFCIGKNINEHPQLFEAILAAGHCIGNHTYNHLNLWNTDSKIYKEDVLKAEEILSFHKENYALKTEKSPQQNHQKLFRPPYGKINPKIAKHLLKSFDKIVMWDVLSYDWDKNTTAEQCYQNVVKNTKSGSIVVFHDSVKASKNLKYTLPKVLKYFSKAGYQFLAIS